MAFGLQDLADEEGVALPGQAILLAHAVSRHVIGGRWVQADPADMLDLQTGQRQPLGQFHRVEIEHVNEVVEPG